NVETLYLSSRARGTINAALIKIIKINDFSAMPTYVRVGDAIVEAIKEEVVEVGDALPSIKDLSYQLQIARDTVEKAYRKLRKEEIIKPSPGKGYFAPREQTFHLRIAVFLNKLSSHKKIVYDALASKLGSD